MKKTLQIWLFILATHAIWAWELRAQDISVSGKVVTKGTTESIPGASILEKGTSNGTISDAEGRFSLNVSPKATLIVSFVGYSSQEITVDGRQEINVALGEDVQSLSEVVVVGYSTTKRENLLGSVVSIKSSDIEQTNPVSAFDGIQGRLSGVRISNNGGPGAGFDIQIRGTSTFGGGTTPLYVVDGQQLDNIDNLDPTQIESLEILKDGASAAIYGSKAANGVVLITTKSGKAGENKVDINYVRTWAVLRSKIPVPNTRQRVFYENARENNVGRNASSAGDSLSLVLRNSHDLQDLVTQVGERNQVNIAFSGGGDKSQYYWNTGILDEEGIVINSGYQRINTTLKVDNQIADKFSGGMRANLSFEEQNGLNENTVFQQIAERVPYYPIYEPNGDLTPEISARQNPLAEALNTKVINRNYRAQLQAHVQWDILPFLSLRSTVGVNGRLRKRNDFDPTIVRAVGDPPIGRERQDLSYDILQENILTFKQTFGKHNLQVLAGTTVQRFDAENSDLQAEFNNDYIETFNNASETFLQRTSSRQGHALTGLFGDVTYDFNDRYLLGITVRRDGSSRFGANRRFGVFPAAKLGWRVSNERFMRGLAPVVSNLKLSATMGTTGNERIGNYDSRTLLRPGNLYGGINGIAPFQLGNDDLGWESTTETNLSMNLGLFNNRLNADVAVWRKETKDLLYDVNIPGESGFGSVRENVGKIENRGIDIAISGTPLRIGKLEWFSSININFQKNKVLELKDGQPRIDAINNRTAYILEEGQPIGNMYGYKNQGVFQYDESNAFTDNGRQLTPVFNNEGNFSGYTLDGNPYNGDVNRLRVGNTVLQGGDIIWEDLNGDFVIDGANDRQVIGNGLVDVFGGFFNEFTYKQWSFSFLFDYSFGQDIFRQYDQLRNDLLASFETPSPERIEGAWLQPGDVAEFARLNRVAQNRLASNSQYVSSGDYIRLRNVRLNYRLAENVLQKVSFINSATIFFLANNLLTWTNYTGYNPELGNRGEVLRPGEDRLRYPNKTDFSMGINVSLK